MSITKLTAASNGLKHMQTAPGEIVSAASSSRGITAGEDSGTLLGSAECADYIQGENIVI